MPNFDFQEMYVSLMTLFFQNIYELQDEISRIFMPTSYQNLSNYSFDREFNELILDFVRYIILNYFIPKTQFLVLHIYILFLILSNICIENIMLIAKEN